MEVELRHLRAFLVVAEERHFGHAAERLHVAQPSLSQQMRRLENELGAELFDRTRRPIRLTAAGEVFLEEARLGLGQVHRAMERGRRAARGEFGHLAIGATSWAHNAIVPSVVRTLRARLPDITLELSTGAPTDQLDAVRDERLDVAFAAFARWPIGVGALAVEPLFEEPMVAIVAQDHPIGRQAEVSLEELARETLVLLCQDVTPGLVDKQMAIFHDHGLAPAAIQEAPDPQAMFSLIAAGVGVGVHMAAFSNLRGRGVTFVQLKGDAPTATLHLFWRRNDDRELVRIFLDTARQMARALQPPELLNGA